MHKKQLKKVNAFNRGNTDLSIHFSAKRDSSDGVVVLLDKLERNHTLIFRISRPIPDQRNPYRGVADKRVSYFLYHF